MVESFGRHLLSRLRTLSGHDRGVAQATRPSPLAREDVLAALEAARTGGSVAVGRLSLVLIGVDRAGDADLARWAVSLLLSAGPAVWKDLDLAARRTWWDTADWARSARKRISRGDPGTLALIVGSFHPDGCVREFATARLTEVNDPVVFSALALRSTDWVPEVRNRARAALTRLLSSSVESLLAVGPLVLVLADREQGSWLFSQLQDQAAALDDADLRRLLRASDWRLRRATYLIALRDWRLQRAELLDAAAHDGDVVIRVECADRAIQDAVAAGAVDEVHALIGSKTAAVRAAAVSALARAGHLDAARAALADHNPTVRAIAQAAVRRSGTDPATRYRELLGDNGEADPAALAGLGETGLKDDAALINPSLQHPAPRGRVESVRALRRLGSIDVPRLVEMLDDPSAAVTRQVVTTLAPHAGDIGVADLAALLEAQHPLHVRSAAYRLLRRRDVWTRLSTDLELYDDPEEDLRNRARGDVEGWLNNDAATSYAIPTAALAHRFDVLLRQAAAALGPERLRVLRFHLGLGDPAS